MTLLLAYASPEYVVTASDRMITWTCSDPATGQERQIYRQHATKSLLVDGHFIVTFSGVADVGGNTERWLRKTFAEISASAELSARWGSYIVDRLRAQLALLVSPTRPPAGLWISLMVAGYQAERPGGEFMPFLVVISNARDDKYGSSRVSDYRVFWHDHLSVLTRQPNCYLWAVGSTPQVGAVITAAEAIRWYRRGVPNRWRGISQPLVRVMLDRARQVNEEGVGSTIQVTVMPRAAIGNAMVSHAALKDPLVETIAFEINSAMQNETVLQNGINVVGHGAMTYDVVVSHGDEPMDKEPFIAPPC